MTANTDRYIFAAMNKAQRTRNLIVEKTAPVFNVKGYAGTSLADMEAATGLTKGSIYGNFANKEEVALAAFEHNWAQAQAAVRAHMEKHASNKDRLLAIAGAYTRLPSGFPEGGCPPAQYRHRSRRHPPCPQGESQDGFPGLEEASGRSHRGRHRRR
ncbi:TetR/AcrR family transcriptional regulator [Lysobacter arenosi]|uniref:TetR/AcrR family transcriptional regulator n=1 Tax=Lysobacter arenosi TaxID=2795387 RepID=A0ABX7R623_9GAMM|nr:TetR/AcrR family transcriptional regulator [Lysobacter arenosi]QSX73494.1 TetR/AcrR family transcriptional regulator [Lysobacter arenosi]